MGRIIASFLCFLLGHFNSSKTATIKLIKSIPAAPASRLQPTTTTTFVCPVNPILPLPLPSPAPSSQPMRKLGKMIKPTNPQNPILISPNDKSLCHHCPIGLIWKKLEQSELELEWNSCNYATPWFGGDPFGNDSEEDGRVSERIGADPVERRSRRRSGFQRSGVGGGFGRNLEVSWELDSSE